MRVLLVEDEEATIRQIQELLEAECEAVVEVARSRDSAIRLLERGRDLDLIVCDLRIPTQDGSLDVAEEHGLRVHDAACEMYPGTFSRFLSGYARLENIGDRLASGPSVDVFGTGQMWAIVDYFLKSRQPEFIAWARELSGEIQRLSHVDIDQSGFSSMSEYEARTLRIYAGLLGGSQIRASRLGGLSSAKVFRVDILDEGSAPVASVVAKVDEISLIEQDRDRYDRYVAPIMGVGTFAPLARTVLHGCGQVGASFYTLASNGYTDLFKLSENDEARSKRAIVHLRDSHKRWQGTPISEHVPVASLRSDYISDDKFDPWIHTLGASQVKKTEATVVRLDRSIQHGDLHGLNVLVDLEGRPLIIDYGTIGPQPVSLDSVTLELSFLFHKEHPKLKRWPTIDHASRWFDLDQYSSGSPISDMIRECRQWALSVATRQQLAAVVYAHATRQLKYEDTSKPLAVAIAKAAMTALTDE